MNRNNGRPLIPGEEARNGIETRNEWGSPQRVALAAAVVGGLLMVLSLAHLAAGLSTRTGDTFLFSLMLSLGIDLSIVVAEAALVVASVQGIRGVKGWAVAWLLISWVTSSTLNALHFTHDLVPWTVSWGFNAFLGALIPTGVLVLSKIGSALAIGQRTQQITELAEARVAEATARAYRRKRKKEGQPS